MNRTYICIDLKSFYASVECVERKLDPLNTNLVVADESRTDKTVCLAITPPLKAYGISGRARLFQVKQRVKEVNIERKIVNNNQKLKRKSFLDRELKENKEYELDFIKAPPRMKLYMEYSKIIYEIYLKYLSPEDIYPYSIDEIFADITEYLTYYNLSAKDLVIRIIEDVYNNTGITATAGIGTNMYLAKIAMDIKAKRMKPNEFGVRIAFLDEFTYKKEFWNHQPLTDFWRIGKGIAKILTDNKMYTLGDVAMMSINNEDLLYKLFGVNAELLIDHVWGYEPCTIKDVKKYKPESRSMSRGQVLHSPYKYESAKLIIREMVDGLVLDLIKENLVTDQLVLIIEYDVSNLTIGKISNHYYGKIEFDHYGRKVPKKARGTINLGKKTNSLKLIVNSVINSYEKIVDPILLIRKINITVCNLEKFSLIKETKVKQLDLFDSIEEISQKEETLKVCESEEIKIQETLLNIKKKFGGNSIFMGMNLEEDSTAIARRTEVGGHRG